MRIELTTTAWEAVVLPLNYTCDAFTAARKRRSGFLLFLL